jgi:SRSO17 transposase
VVRATGYGSASGRPRGVTERSGGGTNLGDAVEAAGAPGVFLGDASRKGYTLLDRRLYLPKEWFAADHRERRAACRIPDETAFARKADLPGRMVEAAMVGGLRAQWLTCDEWYGRDTGFLDGVAERGLRSLAEVSKHLMLWPLSDPATGKARPRPQTWLSPHNPSG